MVNFTFTVLNEEQCTAAAGNHSLAILNRAETYEELAAGLNDLIEEAEDLQVVTVGDKVYQTEFFLGGDWKFLALVCGIDSANAEHSCIWCKCPKHQ